MRRILLITVVLPLLALPAGAQAQGGGSAVDEYTENVPGAGGDKPSDNVGGGGSSGTLPPDVVSALEAQGADGAAAAALAQATSPKGGEGAKGEGPGGASDTAGSNGSGGGGGVGEVLSQLAGGGNEGSDEGMGVALPIVLGVALLGAVALLIARRRGQTEPGEPA